MKVNNRLFLSIVGIVSTIAIIGYLFLSYIKLEEPYFFEHYYDQELKILAGGGLDSRGAEFELKYITNLYTDKEVTYIEFPEAPELVVQASEYPYGISSTSTPGKKYGPYSVRTIYVEPLEMFGVENFDHTTVTQAKLFCSDSSTKTVDIGTLNFFMEMPDEFDTELLRDYGSFSDSKGYSEEFYEVSNEFTLTNIRSETVNKFDEWISLRVNNQSIETMIGKTFQPGEAFNSTSEIIKNQGEAGDIFDRFTKVRLRPKLTLTDSNGQQHTRRLSEIQDREEIDFFDLFEYVKAKGGL